MSTSSNDPPPTAIYTLSLHDALPISMGSWQKTCQMPVPTWRLSVNSMPWRLRFAVVCASPVVVKAMWSITPARSRSEEHTSELQSQSNLVCRLLLEKKKKNKRNHLTD